MLTLGLVLLLAGLLVCVALPRAREIGLIAAVVGGLLIVLTYLPV
jgi:hypothetical protein